MAEISLERRFHGQVNLATLHLWRVAKSTSIDEGFAAAYEMRMIHEDDERFIRECIALDARLQAGEASEADHALVTEELVKRLQLCAHHLNSADPC